MVKQFNITNNTMTGTTKESTTVILLRYLFVTALPATQNVLKYTQTHREIEVLADTSYCFNVYALAIVNNTLLTSSCTLHSRKFLR